MMILTDDQWATIRGVVNWFETSSVLGRYAAVTVTPADKGGLSYGRSQATRASGTLHQVIEAYLNRVTSPILARYLDALEARDPDLDDDLYFHNLLRAAADDPEMRRAQDHVFDHLYLVPALERMDAWAFVHPLSALVIYDSLIHGSLDRVRRRIDGRYGEREWVGRYLREREDWLLHHRNRALPPTIYRVRILRSLVEAGAWELDLPLVATATANGRQYDLRITADDLHGLPPDVYDGPPLGSRPLRLESPMLRGADVRQFQVGLSNRPGSRLIADGIYGPRTSLERQLHQARGLDGA